MEQQARCPGHHHSTNRSFVEDELVTDSDLWFPQHIFPGSESEEEHQGPGQYGNQRFCLIPLAFEIFIDLLFLFSFF